MSCHNKKLYIIFAALFAFLTGCATTYAPDNWLPDTGDVPQNIYGGWITVITEPDSSGHNEKWMQYSGEFIATDSSVIYLLFDSLYQIPKWKIKSSTLELDEKSEAAYGSWTFLGTVSTISNGAYLVFTAPLWLLTGIPAAVGESVRDRYEADEPTEEYWNNINKFARFPQGITNINLSAIKPIFKPNELK